MPAASRIVPLTDSGFDAFRAWLDRHVADNGSPGTGYFQPQSRVESVVEEERIAAFRAGLALPVDGPGWRRGWVALDDAGGIVGHVDLKARPERHAGHRCLLGMGVDGPHRGAGLGARLLAHACAWAAAQGFAWIDLQVLSVNETARRLYRRAGFVETGAVDDLFRFDGGSFGFVSMSLALAPVPTLSAGAPPTRTPSRA